MNEARKIHPVRGFCVMLKKLFFFCCVLIAGFAVIGYAAGWITLRHDDTQEKATIEISTGEVKQAASEAVDKGQELIQRAGEQIEEIGQSGEDDRAGEPAQTDKAEQGEAEPPS